MKLVLKVHPGSRQNEVLGLRDGLLEVKVAAPANEGRANSELVAFLAKLLDVAKSDISVLRGAASRIKVLSIPGLTSGQVGRKLGVPLDDD